MLRHYLTDTGHPARLFKGGEPGFCLPSVAEALRVGALWQDAAGSTPGAVGSTVGRMGFIAGLSSIASQGTATKRPLLTTDSKSIPLLRFDGIDDCLVTPSIDFSGREAVTVIAGIIKAETMVAGALLEHGNAASVDGAFSVYAPLASAYSGRHIRIGQRGSSMDGGVYYNIESNKYVFAQQFVAAGVDRANRYPAWAINGNTLHPRLATGPSDPLLATSFLNDVLYVGQRTASINPFNGDLYSLTVIGRRLSHSEMLNTSRWINEQMGRVY